MRKTITLPRSTLELVHDQRLEGESFSAAVVRLIEAGSRAKVPAWVGSAEGPGDLSRRDEEILREIFSKL